MSLVPVPLITQYIHVSLSTIRALYWTSEEPIHELFFHRNSNPMEDWFYCNSIVGYHIATTFCTKFKVKVMAKVKPAGHIWAPEFNRYVCFSFRWESDHFWLRYSKFYIWPWKFKVKVMAKVKPAGHIWASEFNRYVCFSFRGNRTIFGWDIANSIFDLENSRSRSWPRSNPLVTFEPQSSIAMFAFRFVAIGPFLAEI